MYESEFEKIIEASQNHSLTFFVGAGVSALSNAPTWKGIIDTISKEMNYEVKDSYSSDEYLRIPQMFYYSIKKTIFYKGIMPSEKVLDLPMDCNTLTGSVNL